MAARPSSFCKPRRWGGLVLALALSFAACGAEPPADEGEAKDVVISDAPEADQGSAHEDGEATDVSLDDADGGVGQSDAPDDSADGRGPGDGDTPGSAACTTDGDCPTSPCATGRCVAGTCVAVMRPDGAACTHSNPCRLGATCAAGVCAGGQDACGCAADADCAKLEDGDACNGTLRCVAGGAPGGKAGRCEVDPATAVTCAASKTTCLVNACDSKTGACKATPVAGTPACEDGDPCTGGTHCKDGSCSGGVGLCACTTSKDCASLADPKTWHCTGTWYCDTKAASPTCKLDPASVVTCLGGDAAGSCTTKTCDITDGNCKTTAKPDKTACDDGNICTGGDHCVGGACQAGPNICGCTSQADCAKQEDGDLCNGVLYCDLLSPSPTCKVLPSSIVSCDTSADGACRITSCLPKTGGCVTQMKGATKGGGAVISCDDGDPCTAGDACSNGDCTPGTPTCPCNKDADCAAKNPKNQCLGTLYCDQASQQCKINPASVVVCPSAADTDCVKNSCQPSTGTCKPTAVAENTPCDADGNPCTAGDVCAKGTCKAGANVCACGADKDCGKFEDGDLCNGTLFCDTAKLPLVCEVLEKTKVTCPTADDTTCAKRVCDPKTGSCPITPVAELEPCDADGNVCTAGDRCLGGTCKAGTNVCGCQKDADCSGKEDGDLCNGTLYCDKSQQPYTCKVAPKTVVSCAGTSAPACQLVTCNKKTGTCGTVPAQDNLPCDDGDACTVGDVCKAGACTGGPDLCSCKADSDCQTGGAQDKCAGVRVCRKDVVPHVCGIKPGSKVTCDAPGGTCFGWQCDAGLCVKSPKNPDKSCSDGDPCTTEDKCAGGECKGTAKSCDDNKACTVDLCGSDGACTHSAPKGLPCSDGDACTANDTCVDGACKAGPALDCDDQQPCTTDTCDPKTGCAHAAQSDGAACKRPDGTASTCKTGKCL